MQAVNRRSFVVLALVAASLCGLGVGAASAQNGGAGTTGGCRLVATGTSGTATSSSSSWVMPALPKISAAWFSNMFTMSPSRSSARLSARALRERRALTR
jgi:ABC-type phosphate transport system substrate-binding protein